MSEPAQLCALSPPFGGNVAYLMSKAVNCLALNIGHVAILISLHSISDALDRKLCKMEQCEACNSIRTLFMSQQFEPGKRKGF